MLRKRIIFTLIYSDDFFNQSRNFRLQKVGNIHWLENNYKFADIASSIDELIILNVSRTFKNSQSFVNVVKKIVKNVFIPICAGGGINSISDADFLFKNGADKIIINSLFNIDPFEVERIIKKYGSQSVVASVDYRLENNVPIVYVNNGQERINHNIYQYLGFIQNIGVGELYLNSIDRDGTGFGFDFESINMIKEYLNIPLIIAGGAGNEKHLLDGLLINEVNAVATANLFNFVGDGLPLARKKLIAEKINLADWER